MFGIVCAKDTSWYQSIYRSVIFVHNCIPLFSVFITDFIDNHTSGCVHWQSNICTGRKYSILCWRPRSNCPSKLRSAERFLRLHCVLCFCYTRFASASFHEPRSALKFCDSIRPPFQYVVLLCIYCVSVGRHLCCHWLLLFCASVVTFCLFFLWWNPVQMNEAYGISNWSLGHWIFDNLKLFHFAIVTCFVIFIEEFIQSWLTRCLVFQVENLHRFRSSVARPHFSIGEYSFTTFTCMSSLLLSI